VLLVTHDVEEALLLADRVLVMDDGVISHEVRVELPRPRQVGHPTLVRLRTELLGRLGIVEPAAAGE
jgi:sulfonate transport system ATP-binding protein